MIILTNYKNMKFISKSSNLLIVLRPGLSAQPVSGMPAKPTISVRFKDGVANVEQADLIKMMLEHPGYENDYISVEEGANKVDPYASNRTSMEPAHEVVELQHGTPVSREIKGDKAKISPEIQKLITDSAIALAKEMLPEMVKATLGELVKNNDEIKVAEPIATETKVVEPIAVETKVTEPVAAETKVIEPSHYGRRKPKK